MKAEIRDSKTLALSNLRIPIADAQALLTNIYPIIVNAFVVKTEIKTTRLDTVEYKEVDWQGCLLHPLVKAIMYHHFKNKTQFHAEKRNSRR